MQTIFVRVANGSTGCANGITSFDVIVLPEPDTFEVSNLSTCDDDLDGDHTNGIVQNFDLDSLIPGILGADQDPDDFTVTFHQSQADASSGDSPLTSPYSNELSPINKPSTHAWSITVPCVLTTISHSKLSCILSLYLR